MTDEQLRTLANRPADEYGSPDQPLNALAAELLAARARIRELETERDAYKAAAASRAECDWCRNYGIETRRTPAKRGAVDDEGNPNDWDSGDVCAECYAEHGSAGDPPWSELKLL